MKNKYEIRGDVTAIFVKRKHEVYEFFIDTEDLDKVLHFTEKTTMQLASNGLYCNIRKYINGKRVYTTLHRVIMNHPDEGIIVDHINRNTLDNRKSNLRIIPKSGNVQNVNVRKDSISLERGVGFHKQSNKWRARIRVDGKRISVGLFENKEDAIECLKKYRAKLMIYSEDHLTVNIDSNEIIIPGSSSRVTNRKSTVRNVSWHESCKAWVVRKRVDGKQLYFGSFKNFEDAVSKANEISSRGAI